jgi:hypothetical protein
MVMASLEVGRRTDHLRHVAALENSPRTRLALEGVDSDDDPLATVHIPGLPTVEVPGATIGELRSWKVNDVADIWYQPRPDSWTGNTMDKVVEAVRLIFAH